MRINTEIRMNLVKAHCWVILTGWLPREICLKDAKKRIVECFHAKLFSEYFCFEKT